MFEEVTVTATVRLAVLAGAACWRGCRSPARSNDGDPVAQGERNAPELLPAFPEQTRAPEAASGVTLAVSELAGGLEHPWGIALLPDGAMIVTERPGRMRVVAADGAVSEPLAGVPAVHAQRQGGLLDVAVGPDFAEDRMVYWSYAKPLGDGRSATAAARGRLSDDGTAIEGATDIFVQTPPSPTAMHYGSRVLFDGDGAPLRHHRRAFAGRRAGARPGSRGELRQGDAPPARRVGPARQSVRRRARRDRGHLDAWATATCRARRSIRGRGCSGPSSTGRRAGTS